jgi:uncharacterized protein HemX
MQKSRLCGFFLRLELWLIPYQAPLHIHVIAELRAQNTPQAISAKIGTHQPAILESTSMFKNLASFFAGIVLLLLSITFSVVAAGLIAVLGLGIWIYFWWKTRKLHQAMKNHMTSSGETVSGEVIEGEATVIEEVSSTANKSPAQHDSL